MKSIRAEMASLLTVLVVPCLVAWVFPYGALEFRATAHDATPSSAAFVKLTDQQEVMLLTTAKSAWRVDAQGVRHLRADLAVWDLPAPVDQPVLASPDLTMPAPPIVRFQVGALPPSQAERVLPPLPVEKPDPPPRAFPDADLLRLR